MKYLDYLNKDSPIKQADSRIPSLRQFKEYLDAINRDPIAAQCTKTFWVKYGKDFPELEAYAKSVLPASSAGVERVFRVGGAILGPSRRRLSDKMFQMLIFLKCNMHLFNSMFL